MPVDRVERALLDEIAAIDELGASKRREPVVTGVLPPADSRGPRYLLEGEGEQQFLRMNANGYLGMARRAEVIEVEEQAARKFGTGPQSVRFISGTYAPHLALEQRLAEFHGREAAVVFNSAYAAVMGVLPPLVSKRTGIVSDELNHNCIINASRLARPQLKLIYPHVDMAELDRVLAEASASCEHVILVTDGVFSMRGDHAPLDAIDELARAHDARCTGNVITMVDDSHGVGALGATGRGTEEVTGARADVLVATLGKALGVNGGYVTASKVIVDYLRETAPLYVYSNPITPAEAEAARAALDLLDSDTGRGLLTHLRSMTSRFQTGLAELGYETISGEHPVVPLMVRDTAQTNTLVRHLRAHGVLATGLSYPVVPRGDEEIRFQISADHTEADIDEALAVLASFPGREAPSTS